MSTISSWNSVSKKARKDFHKSSETTDDKDYQDFLGKKFEYIKDFCNFFSREIRKINFFIEFMLDIFCSVF